MAQGEAGKGDTYRKVDYKKWDDNWDRIFKKKSKNADTGEDDSSLNTSRSSENSEKERNSWEYMDGELNAPTVLYADAVYEPTVKRAI